MLRPGIAYTGLILCTVALGIFTGFDTASTAVEHLELTDMVADPANDPTEDMVADPANDPTDPVTDMVADPANDPTDPVKVDALELIPVTPLTCSPLLVCLREENLLQGDGGATTRGWVSWGTSSGKRINDRKVSSVPVPRTGLTVSTSWIPSFSIWGPCVANGSGSGFSNSSLMFS